MCCEFWRILLGTLAVRVYGLRLSSAQIIVRVLPGTARRYAESCPLVGQSRFSWTGAGDPILGRQGPVLGVKPRLAAGQPPPEPDSSSRRRGKELHHVHFYPGTPTPPTTTLAGADPAARRRA